MTAPAPEPRLVILTPQQRKVIGQLTHDGASDETIARRMGLSVWTVRSHTKAAMKRADARTRTQLAVMLLKRQIVIRVENHAGRPGRRKARA